MNAAEWYRRIHAISCPTCKGYAWIRTMSPTWCDLDGSWHHPSCPMVRHLDERQSMIVGGRLVSPWRG